MPHISQPEPAEDDAGRDALLLRALKTPPQPRPKRDRTAKAAETPYYEDPDRLDYEDCRPVPDKSPLSIKAGD